MNILAIQLFNLNHYIRKEDKRVVGSIDYKNIPNEIKEVEIGYGLEKQFEHNGYMTEAVSTFCKMAFMDEDSNASFRQIGGGGLCSAKPLYATANFLNNRNVRRHLDTV